MHVDIRLIARLLLAVLVFGMIGYRPPAGVEGAEQFRRSFRFPGDGATYVEVADAADLTLSSALTLEAWIYPLSTAGCGPTAVSKSYTTPGAPSYWFGLCNGKVALYSSGLQADSGQTSGAQVIVPTNVWTHIAVSWTPSERRYYLNGDLEFVGTGGPSPTDNAGPLLIGQSMVSPAIEAFTGWIAEVRVWNTVRTQGQIRELMHTAVQEKHAGLVGAWNLTDHANDAVGGHGGAFRGNPTWTFSQAPTRPAVVPIDAEFLADGAQPSVGRRGMAGAHATSVNRLILAGGYNGDSPPPTTAILSLDPSNGRVVTLAGTLPQAVSDAAAAYAPGRDRVYLFGGMPAFGGPTNAIVAIDPVTGAATTVGATLSAGLSQLAAVYHPPTGKIVLIGGQGAGGPVATISLFDPATETLSPPGLSLLVAERGASAVVSGLTGQIYLVGENAAGVTTGSTVIRALTLVGDGIDSVRTLGAVLPGAGGTGFGIVEDPVTGLIAILGGDNAFRNRVIQFDPVTEQVWETKLAQPEIRTGGVAVYDRTNRHALLVGGVGGSPSLAKNTIWKIPLGNGVAMPVGDWSNPIQWSSGVVSIDGDEDFVAFGTQSSGTGVFRADGIPQTVYDLYNEEPGQPERVRYSAATGRLWLQGNSWTIVKDYPNNTTEYHPASLTGGGINNMYSALEIAPGGQYYGGSTQSVTRLFDPFLATYELPQAGAPRYGTVVLRMHELFVSKWFERITSPGFEPGVYGLISALRHRAPGDLWAIGLGTGTNLAANLYRLTYDPLNRVSELGMPVTYHGVPCNLGNVASIVWGPNNDLWLAGQGSIPAAGLQGICRVLGLPDAPAQLLVDGALAVTDRPVASQVSVDRDGRVWFTRGPNSLTPGGGVSAFQSVPAGLELRTGDYNWENAPVGTRGFALGAWQSNLTAVGAVDEKVWFGGTDGRVIAVTQRWGKLESTNGLFQRSIDKIFHARGRTFLASSSNIGGGLAVLQPDGITWDNRSGIQVRAGLGDRRGRIWVGTDSGVRRYLPTGWDLLDGVVGDVPTGPVRALAEDADGRIWIGGDNGLTLFDRDRFVATFTTANSTLPHNRVNALLVDRTNRLWVGTQNGLARLDGATFTTIAIPGPALSTVVVDLTQPSDGRIAVSTSAGLGLYDGTSFTVDNVTDNLPVATDEQGRLWAGGSVKEPTGSYQNYYWTNSGLARSTVGAVAATGAGQVWFGHWPNGGVSVRGSYLPPLPEVIPDVTSVTPDGRTSGQEVTITGTGFGTNREDVEVRIGGVPLEILTVNGNTMTARLGPLVQSGDIVVKRGRRSSAKSIQGRPFYCVAPSISVNKGFLPEGGNVGVPIRIVGTNFDPRAEVAFGTGTLRPISALARTFNIVPGAGSAVPAQAFTAEIRPDDTSGNVRVRNSTPGCPGFEATRPGFNVVPVFLESFEFNQGLPSVPLVAFKPTLLRMYLTAPGFRPGQDALQMTQIFLTERDPATGFQRTTSVLTRTATIMPLPSPVPAAFKTSITQGFNVVIYPNADSEKTIKITNGGYQVAERIQPIGLRKADQHTVLLVPIMASDYTQADLAAFKAGVDASLQDLRSRMMPWGSVTTVWSPESMRRSQTLALGAGNIDDRLRRLRVVQELNRIRKRYQGQAGGANAFVVGLLHPRVQVDESTIGLSMNNGNDLEDLGGSALEALCDFAPFGATFVPISLAALLIDCDLDVPRTVVFAATGTRIVDTKGLGNLNTVLSHVIAHELAHSLGLVAEGAPNYEVDLKDRPGGDHHSMMDELDGGSCSNGGATFNPRLTLYGGIYTPVDPVVNPLLPLPVAQLTNTLNVTTTTNGLKNSVRAKATLSYACGITSSNSFLERPDYFAMNREFLAIRGGQVSLTPAIANGAEVVRRPQPKVVVGQRIAVSALITPSTNTASFEEVRALGPDGSLSPSFIGDLAFVQLNASGQELSRIGPTRLSEHSHNNPGGGIDYLSATMLAQPGLASLQIRNGTQVLATYQPGAGSPSVSLTSPTGGSYSNGSIPVTWTASDPDGDPVLVSIDYSRDGGANWQGVGSGGASGTFYVPVFLLGGSTNARIRVVASDGFHSASATSGAFTVANQPPSPYIGAPLTGSLALESRAVVFEGGASDVQDSSVAETGLRWTSSRDGLIGTGARLLTTLSVGRHTISLQATNTVGVAATTSIILDVDGDYDDDGIADSQEAGLGLNPLNGTDASKNANGLPFNLKLHQGLNPGTADTDGDGRSDADELAAGTNPFGPDSPVPANTLGVSPSSISWTYNHSVGALPAQKQLFVTSGLPVNWTVTSNVPWLVTTVGAGRTLGSTVAVANVSVLTEGGYSGKLTFTSADLGQTVEVPVTITVIGNPKSGSGGRVIHLPIALRGHEGGW